MASAKSAARAAKVLAAILDTVGYSPEEFAAGAVAGAFSELRGGGDRRMASADRLLLWIGRRWYGSSGPRAAARRSARRARLAEWRNRRGGAPGSPRPWALLSRIVAAAAIRWLLVLQIAYILALALLLTIFRSLDPPATVLMLYRKWGYGWELKPPRPLPLAKVPRLVRTMTIRVEDGDFYGHHGIVLAAIKNAYQLNQRFGEPLYGGSTITMQAARTLFLVPEKTYFRKYLEAIAALEMEAILGKDRILELYFDYAEWGRGVFGVDAGARYHFGKGVAALSRDEAIRLVTLLSSPIRYGPYSFRKNGILKIRYAYLDKRFGSGLDGGPSAAPAPEVPARTDDAAGSGDVAPPDEPPPSIVSEYPVSDEAPPEDQGPSATTTTVPAPEDPAGSAAEGSGGDEGPAAP